MTQTDSDAWCKRALIDAISVSMCLKVNRSQTLYDVSSNPYLELILDRSYPEFQAQK